MTIFLSTSRESVIALVYSGELHDGEIQQEVEFIVTISLPEAILDYVIAQNEAPELIKEPKEAYTKDYRAGRRGIIDFEGIKDVNGDEVTVELKSKPSVDFFRFDKERA